MDKSQSFIYSGNFAFISIQKEKTTKTTTREIHPKFQTNFVQEPEASLQLPLSGISIFVIFCAPSTDGCSDYLSPMSPRLDSVILELFSSQNDCVIALSPLCCLQWFPSPCQALHLSASLALWRCTGKV